LGVTCFIYIYIYIYMYILLNIEDMNLVFHDPTTKQMETLFVS